MNLKYLLVLLIYILLIPAKNSAQDSISAAQKLSAFVKNINTFNHLYPQEKVYLHFDNTGYFKGDTIWFKCYVTTADENKYTNISKVLYVELLSPEGNVVDSRKLKIENGQCHGEFALKSSGYYYYSGYYEIRAYTKYMMNWGEEGVFSRVFPVYEEPENDGDYSKRIIKKHKRRQTKNFDREKTEKDNKVNATFYPEGGNLVNGITSRVAFKVTDEYGMSIDVTANIRNRYGMVDSIKTVHLGMGSFDYFPSDGNNKVEFLYNKKSYSFNLPKPLPEGYTMLVDNSDKEKLNVTLQRSTGIQPEILGIAVMHGGKVSFFDTLAIDNDSLVLGIPKIKLSAGVNQITLFNQKGEPLCERLFFVDMKQKATIKLLTQDKLYKKFEQIQLDFQTEPGTTFSLSVRDAAGDVAVWNDNILTNMLLSSDLKGFIENPAYYFNNNDSSGQSQKTLDLLLMVQGWRRYEWKEMAKEEKPDMKYLPEEGIILEGSIVPILNPKTKKPYENMLDSVELKLDIYSGDIAYPVPVTLDKEGKFRLLIDDFNKNRQIRLSIVDRNMQESTVLYANKYKILLDRVFVPDPRTYTYTDMYVQVPGIQILPDKVEEERRKLDEIQILPEVMVVDKKKEEPYMVYNVDREKTILRDQGKRYPKDIIDYLSTKRIWVRTKYYNGPVGGYVDESDKRGTNIKHFIDEVQIIPRFEKGWSRRIKLPPFRVSLDEVRKIIVYDSDLAYKNMGNKAGGMLFLRSSTKRICTLGLSTYEKDYFVDKQEFEHIRATKLEGYSVSRKSYTGNNPPLPGNIDYRRTLYWNPNATADKEGKTSISFYNNSSCRQITISSEGLTGEGVPVVLDK